MQASDGPDKAYDGDAISQRLDAAFSETFGADCTALWIATGTAGNCAARGASLPCPLRAGHPTSAPHHLINLSPRQRFLR
jgi:threonine aldolase